MGGWGGPDPFGGRWFECGGGDVVIMGVGADSSIQVVWMAGCVHTATVVYLAPMN